MHAPMREGACADEGGCVCRRGRVRAPTREGACADEGGRPGGEDIL